jgi:bifunctional UDP-N-acetylglucosamine pyrophosphorylase/glucosamine-1-phosphate N-acetyltransferase
MGLSVIILAAGQGKRMKSDLPKVLQPLAGRALLAHVIEAAKKLSPTAIHVVYGHGGEQVRAAFAHENIQWALQAEQKGTGHAVMQAMPTVSAADQVLVLYGDVPLIEPATLRLLRDASDEQTLSLLSVRLPDPTGYGRVLRDNAGSVYRIVEQKDATRKELSVNEVNTGLVCAPAAALNTWLSALSNDNAQGEYYLTDIVAMAVRQGFKVSAVAAPTIPEVLGINDKRQLAEVEAHYRQARASALMDAGVTLIDPTRLDVRGEVQVGRDVIIEPNVTLSGNVVLGHRVQIGAGCLLTNVTVGDDTIIHPYCVLQDAAVGSQCVIGPYARLRPGTELAQAAHVGNFVELKNTRLGEGSKANHLTYLGDAVVGARVNVGAGTITCNYDGVNKWRTVIEDGAFIGSGSMLVAPVSVGKGATIGAGTTLTRSAPPSALTLERAKQQTLPRWSRPVKVSKEEKAEREAKSLNPVTPAGGNTGE